MARSACMNTPSARVSSRRSLRINRRGLATQLPQTTAGLATVSACNSGAWCPVQKPHLPAASRRGAVPAAASAPGTAAPGGGPPPPAAGAPCRRCPGSGTTSRRPPAPAERPPPERTLCLVTRRSQFCDHAHNLRSTRSMRATSATALSLRRRYSSLMVCIASCVCSNALHALDQRACMSACPAFIMDAWVTFVTSPVSRRAIRKPIAAPRRRLHRSPPTSQTRCDGQQTAGRAPRWPTGHCQGGCQDPSHWVQLPDCSSQLTSSCCHCCCCCMSLAGGRSNEAPRRWHRSGCGHRAAGRPPPGGRAPVTVYTVTYRLQARAILRSHRLQTPVCIAHSLGGGKQRWHPGPNSHREHVGYKDVARIRSSHLARVAAGREQLPRGLLGGQAQTEVPLDPAQLRIA